jgi:2-hydroxychromene-2-carboxylate isomerase
VSAPARRIAPHVVAALTSARTRDARRWLAERTRRLRGAPHRVYWFHQADDPYSQLAAQVLPRFVERYDVALVPHLVGPPPDAAAPERARLEAFARKDAADVASGYGLAFPRGAPAPRPALVSLAERILARAQGSAAFAAVAPRVGAALWSGDAAALETLAASHGAAEPNAARAAAEAGSRLRARLGHYLGATFQYAGEWYWGVDRLHHLERRLQALGALRGRPGAAPPLVARPDFSTRPPPETHERLALEVYPSLRSPYTAIAFERVFALGRRLPVELVWRPVLPMVMRGLAVPRAKRLYITLDARREAEDAGVPFGRICDPVGRPVERAFSLWPFARAAGRGAEYLHAFAHASFAEGIDTGTDAGLRHAVERAGLDWGAARAELDREGWREELEANCRQLLALGLWGVPSFRLLGRGGELDFCTWGQDRIWRVEEEIRRRLGGAASRA